MDELPITTYATISETEISRSMDYTREYFNEPHTFCVDGEAYEECVQSLRAEVHSICAGTYKEDDLSEHPSSAPHPQDQWTELYHQLVAVLNTEGEVSDRSLDVFYTNTLGMQSPDYMGLNLVTLGFAKSVRIMKMAAKWAFKVQHKMMTRMGKQPVERNGQNAAYLADDQVKESEKLRRLSHLAIQSFARCESQALIAQTTPHQREHLVYKDGILHHAGRLTGLHEFKVKDLDFHLVPDACDFQELTPIILPRSPLLFAYVMYIHEFITPHAGVEIVLAEVLKRFYIVGAKRFVISKVRNDCVKCRILAKKTVELEMAKIHPAKLELAPVFYNVQMDIAYGPFRCQAFKKTRSIKSIYALVIVCVLTGATNILVLEGIETQDVIAALERHSARYGYPAEIFVDAGSQLVALEKSKVMLRDANTFLYESRGTTVTVSCPKAHESRGKVERKIQAIRDTLKRMDVNCYDPVSAITWETIFAKVANALDNLPIVLGDSSNTSDLAREVLTPNRLKMGRNNNRSIEGSIEFTSSALPTDILNRNRKITAAFLKLIMERAHHLISGWKWKKTDNRQPVSGDIVLFRFSDNQALREEEQWRLGRVIDTTPTRVKIMYPGKSDRLQVPKTKFLERSHRDVVILASENDPDLNSEAYYKKIIAQDE